MGRVVRIVSLLIVAAASALPSFAQTRKPTNEEWDLVKPLFKLVESVAAGQPAPADLTLSWQCHFLNADAGVVFVPFTLKIDRGELTSFPVAMYVRVVVHGAPAPAPGPKDPLAQYPFEDAAVLDDVKDGRITRAFTAPAGDYDVYVALSEKPDAAAPQPKTVVYKQTVQVPDLKSALATSSIIVADRIEIDPRNRRLNIEEQLDEPYAWWGNKLTPALRTRYGRSEKLSVIFLVYNTAARDDDKPDVEVQYNVYKRAAGAADAFINSAPPEMFNGGTLRREFSQAAGDLIIAGRQVPLSRFADGDYRLVITVADRIKNASITRDVSFTVAGP